ncbi:MAG: pilus assembly protein [Betaproteobacteria bacterium]
MPHFKLQQAMALPVVLVMLLLITLIGIGAVRTMLSQEGMVAGSYDRSMALQSNEQELRTAEDTARNEAYNATTFNNNFPQSTVNGKSNGSSAAAACNANQSDPSPCANGLCSQPTPQCLPRWEDSNFAGWQGDQASGGLLSNKQVQYIVEFMGEDFSCNPPDPNAIHECSQYRVTVRTTPNLLGRRAAVVLQSYYLTQPK